MARPDGASHDRETSLDRALQARGQKYDGIGYDHRRSGRLHETLERSPKLHALDERSFLRLGLHFGGREALLRQSGNPGIYRSPKSADAGPFHTLVSGRNLSAMVIAAIG